MKRRFNLIAVLVMVFAVLLITGCEKRTELKFEGEEGTIVFNVKEKAGYKISTDKKDLRTSREQGALVGNDFKIGIEFNDDLDYFFEGDFNKLVEKRKADYDDAKEVKYGDFTGVQYFYGGYNCTNILLKVEGSKDYFLELSVYGAKDTEEAAKAAIANEEVLDVLNNITSIKAAK